MAEQWIEEIYEDAYLATMLKQISELNYIGAEEYGADLWNQNIPALISVCEKYERIQIGKGQAMMRLIHEIKDVSTDRRLFADKILSELVPMIYDYLQMLGHINVDDGKYILESSNAGYISLTFNNKSERIHELFDPMEEARILAEQVYRPENDIYCILGSGLGYLAYQIYLISEGTAKIRIYELDDMLITYAYHYGVLDWIPEENLYVEQDKDIMCFLRYVADNEPQCIISKWILSDVSKSEHDIIHELVLEYSTMRDVADRCFAINMYSNLKYEWHCFEEFPKEKAKKDFIVVAAGPSLDASMDFLMCHAQDMTIVVVGTAFRKLVNRGIVPDIVAVIESHELVYRQFEGLEDQSVPLVMPMCGYWKIPERYAGDVYLVPTSDSRESIAYANEHDMQIWGVGGTVSYLAMDIALHLGAENIYLLGLDLAYPDAMTHCEDTVQSTTIDVDGMMLVQQVGGGKVPTDSVFNYYRKFVEACVQKHKEVTFYNLSKKGARIKGTIEI